MQEYKREKNILESRLEALEKRSIYHDDHIRITDAWFLQVRFLLPICGLSLTGECPRLSKN